MSELKKTVKERTGIPPEEQRLIFAGKQLNDKDYLNEYPKLGGRSTIFLVLRLPGGSIKPFDLNIERGLPSHLPKSDTHCFLCFDEPALFMPCKPVKHSVCPPCLVEYAWSEVSTNNKTTVKCSLCKSEWGLDVIAEYGQASSKEIELLSEGLSMNVIRTDPKINFCPGCNSFCERKDTTKPRVRCNMCVRQGNENVEFCWNCLQPWTNNSSQTECSNAECDTSGILAQIAKAPMTEVVGVKCPSNRLCPNCGIPIEHNTGCKQMICKPCQTEFCFICLRIKTGGRWQCGSYNTKCAPAPIQTSVPKKN